MTKSKVLEQILDYKIVAIIRGLNTEQSIQTTKALIKGGIHLIEVTLDSPNALNTISTLSEMYNSNKVLIGAGTVLDSESARTCILSGAEFLISPILDYDFIKMCRRYDKLAIPGVMTPTEIFRAWEMGADIVKVFPAGSLGCKYIKSVKGPLKDVKIMATGGININNALDFINHGADALGVGGSLVDKNAINNCDYEAISVRAMELINKL